jgi:hypothetical protein
MSPPHLRSTFSLSFVNEQSPHRKALNPPPLRSPLAGSGRSPAKKDPATTSCGACEGTGPPPDASEKSGPHHHVRALPSLGQTS